LIVLALGEFMILLDATIVNVAIPNMIQDLHATLTQVLWVLNAYVLTFAVLLLTAGRLGAMFGPKRLFIGGMVLFTAASAACAVSQTPNQLILFRVLQAVGGAALTPQTLSIITSIFPPDKRGQAFGIWGVVYGLGGASGPTLGGLLTSGFSWRAIFVPNIPIGIAATLAAFLIMPELTVHRRQGLDVVGVALATGGLFALVFGLVEGQDYGWGRISSVGAFDLGPLHAGLVSIPSIFFLSAVLLVAFVVWETRQDEPLLPLSLFRDRNFSIGCTISAIQVFGMIGLYFPLTLYLQRVLHLTPLQAGVAVLPQAIASMAVAPGIGKLADRVNGKYLLTIGLILYSVGVGLIIWLATIHSTGATFTLPLVVLGVGVGVLAAPVVTLTMQRIIPSASGAASGFMNTIRQVGGALAAAVGGAILETGIAANQKSQAVQFATQLPSQFRSAFIKHYSASTGSITVGAPQGGTGLPGNLPAAVARQFQTLGQLVSGHSYLNAMKPALVVPLALALGGATLALFMSTPRRAPAAAPVPAPAEVPAAAAERAQELAVPAAATPAARVPVPVFAAVHGSDTIVMPVSIPRNVQPTRPTRSMRPPFLVQVGDPARAEHFIKNTLRIGRMPNLDLVVQDPQVSRRHAEITSVDGEYVVRDLQSANGTMVNNRRIAEDHPLHEGDTITVGDTSFVYHDDFEIARPRLLRTEADGRGQYLIRKSLSIGRLPGNDIVLAHDTKVSRRHALLSTYQGKVFVRDLNSLNGTKVNGELVAEDHLLQDGDIVTIGDTSFTYHNDFEAANPIEDS
jgi:EmrB/QacA subfamily drug resistance transporter